jgi:branched-chain amino acid transport system ATP-binding protein
VLRVENISVFYKDVQALRDVSLEVPDKKIVALLGPNAAGKSTTIRTISAQVKARTGRITLDGAEIQNSLPYQIVESGIIQVPEGRGLFSTLTVRENLELGAYTSRARPFIAKNMEQVYTFFPRLKERETQQAGSLSGGEQQMCAIGRGLMANPRLLMIDEMSLGLAPRLVKQMFLIVRQIAETGFTILLVEQQIHRALQIASSAFVLENGSTTLSGNTADLLRHEHIKKVYLGI